MIRQKTAALLLLTVAVAAGVMLPAGAIPGAAGTADQAGQGQGSTERVSAEVGQQLSTVVVATTQEVKTEADEAAFEQQLDQTNATARAEAIAQRAADLDRRAGEVRSEYASVTESYRSGDITGSAYAQEIASLSVRASAIDSSVDRLETRAAQLSAAERRAVGVTDADLQDISEQIESLSSPTASAILSQFTGQTRGEIELEANGGIELEVTNEDGERSRQFERPRDGNGTYVLTQSEALAVATDTLSDQDGEWILTSASADDGAYEFEFRFSGAGEGEAEVSVDGETGTVFELEESIESDDDDDEREDDRLAVRVTEGEPGPGSAVTLTVTDRSGPVEGATVAVNDETVGQTDANGTVAVTLPADEAEIEATAGDAEGELEFEFEDEESEERSLAATADITDGTVTVSVLLGDQPLDGANVTANEQFVGTTDGNGTASFSLPADDELEIDITYQDLEAELEYDLEADEDDGVDGDDDSESDDDDDSESDDDDDSESDDDDDSESDDDDDSDDDRRRETRASQRPV